MRQLAAIFLLLFAGLNLMGQTAGEAMQGEVSFITTQHVYVKFQSTAGITAGDTLFVLQNGERRPALIVKDLSSISCVCSAIPGIKISAADKIIAEPKTSMPLKQEKVDVSPVVPIVAVAVDTITRKEKPVERKQNVYGRISVSSYSNFSSVADFSQRMRYTFALNANNINDSKLSAETYISFSHKINEWDVIKEDIFNGLKVYSLSLSYAFNPKNNISFGRKINTRISNVGAIDGLQYETRIKSFTAGAFAGTRPDYENYSFNADLLQYGAYVSHDFKTATGDMQNSLAFVQQMNNGQIDRRFAYFQHSNALLRGLYFFGSVEADLYSKVLNTTDSTYTTDNSPSLSNVYVSLRYKVIKQLSLSLSYSARQNIIYYETYKNIVEQLLDMEGTQGYMFQANYRPGKNISLGANAGYRFSKLDPRPTKNLYSYITYSNVPWIHASATLSATLMETSYTAGQIYSLGLSRDLLPGKLYGGLTYRFVNYNFVNNEDPLTQHMGEVNLTWRVMKKLLCSLNYEGTFESQRNYNRVYINLTQRF
jgi:hypothetical protein